MLMENERLIYLKRLRLKQKEILMD